MDQTAQMPTRRSGREIDAEVGAWVWLWSPLVFLAAVAILRVLDQPAAGIDPSQPGAPGYVFNQWVESEGGVIENLTVLMLLWAMVLGVGAIRLRNAVPRPRMMAAWLALLVVGSFFIAAEEISWGQQWFGWSTPDWIGAVNDQGETNLHNTSSWLDQKPRAAFLLWVIVAGLVYPTLKWLRGWRYDRVRDWRYWFWPTNAVVPVAALSLVARLPEYLAKITTDFDWMLVIRYSELQEFYFAMFLVVYLGSFATRARAVSS
jgi:hypothetical protein